MKPLGVRPSDSVRRFLREMLPVVVTGCAGLLVFHRATLLSGFDIVQADIGDSRLVVFLLEHWNQVFAWNAAWASPSIFYPVKGVLGYSEMMFGTGVLYTLFRNVGLSLFQATNATLVLLSLLSYLSAYWLLRRILKMSRSGSIVGAFFFAFAYPKFAQLGHLQLRFDFFQPLAIGVIAPLLLEERAMRQRELVTRTSIFAGLVCLAASTAFYHAWFFVFFLGVSALVAVSYRKSRALMVMRLREARRVLWIPPLLCAMALTPFFSIYLPSLKLGVERNWASTIEYLPRLSSYLWLGPEHWLWGNLAFNSSSNVAIPIENRLGFGFAVTALVLVGWAWGIQHLARAIRGAGQSSTPRSDWLSAFLVSSLIVTALTVRWDSFYPWKTVYELVPGASVMRGVGRWTLTLALPVSILIAVAGGWIQQFGQGRRVLSRGIFLAAGLFIAIEQVGRIPLMYSGEVASRYHEQLAHTIPASCKAFLLVPPVQDKGPLIARRYFDEAKYIEENPDVEKNWPGNAWNHYSQFGYREGRGFDPKTGGTRQYFDEAEYLAENPDIGKDWSGRAWDHYSQFGYREGRGVDPDATALRQFNNLHYHLSAMIASALSGKPTVNGASGFGPPDYLVSNLYEPDIVQSLDAWMSRHPGTSACLISKEITPYGLTDRGPHASFLGIALMD